MNFIHQAERLHLLQSKGPLSKITLQIKTCHNTFNTRGDFTKGTTLFLPVGTLNPEWINIGASTFVIQHTV